MKKYDTKGLNVVKRRGTLAIHAGSGMARGLYMGVNLESGKVSYWDNRIDDIKLSDCVH